MPSSLVPAPAVPAPAGAGAPGRGPTDSDGAPGAQQLLTIDVDDRGDTAVLRLRGEVDLLTADALHTALHTWLHLGVQTVVADLRGVSFIACAGVGALAEARRLADRRGVGLQIVPGRAVARVAALLDLGDALGLPRS